MSVDDLVNNTKIRTFAIRQAFKMLEESKHKIPMILDVAREMMCDKLLLYGDFLDFFYVSGDLEVTLKSRMYKINTLEEVSMCNISECFDVEVKLRIILMRHNPIDILFTISQGLDERTLLWYPLLSFNDSLHLECFEDFLKIRDIVEKELNLLV